jgi:hypothetical protein
VHFGLIHDLSPRAPEADSYRREADLSGWPVPNPGKERRTSLARTAVALRYRPVSRSLVLATLVMLWTHPVEAATLVWNANTESDLAGYRVYQCAQQPCGKASGTATLLATLGTVTSFDIGTPAVVQFYVITAYDFANNESFESSVAIYTPAAPTPTPTPPPAPPPSPPPTPPPTPTPTPEPPPSASVTLNVLGAPNLGEPWTVQAAVNASGPISVEVRINGALDHTERQQPFCAFGESSGSCRRVQRPPGTYDVEFRVLSSGTELARQSITVTAAAPPGPPPPAPPPAPSNLRLSAVQ